MAYNIFDMLTDLSLSELNEVFSFVSDLIQEKIPACEEQTVLSIMKQ